MKPSLTSPENSANLSILLLHNCINWKSGLNADYAIQKLFQASHLFWRHRYRLSVFTAFSSFSSFEKLNATMIIRGNQHRRSQPVLQPNNTHCADWIDSYAEACEDTFPQGIQRTRLDNSSRRFQCMCHGNSAHKILIVVPNTWRISVWPTWLCEEVQSLPWLTKSSWKGPHPKKNKGGKLPRGHKQWLPQLYSLLDRCTGGTTRCTTKWNLESNLTNHRSHLQKRNITKPIKLLT